jgi:pSer/pThr/pTyr-binding forkhead associated (FHA) protein
MKVTINIPGAPVSEAELRPGVNRFGRSLNTDIPIAHPSVSGAHCEIVNTNGALVVKDLGSTNGTTIDGKPVQEEALVAGQILRLGEVELVFDVPSPARPVIRVTAVASPVPIPPPLTSAAPRPLLSPLASAPSKRLPPPPQKSFYQSLPGAFVYPFRRDGWILLVGGTIFFVIMQYASAFAGIISLGIGIFTFGYIFAFMQSIITTTALGDEELPHWPDFDGMTSFFEPFLQMLAIFLFCLGPFFLYWKLVSDPQVWVAAALLVGGLLYLPMAVLAVTIYDSVAALNPLLIILSVTRVPLEYAATCLAFGLLFGLLALASYQLDEAGQSRVVTGTVGVFFTLYTLTVMMRINGMLFYTKRSRLHWEMGPK